MGRGVNAWLKPRTIVIVLFALSIGTKLILSASEYGDDEQARVVERQVVSFLGSNGFHVNDPELDVQLWTVTAVKGTCHMRVAVVSPHGWHRQVVRHTTPPGSKVFFVVDGRIYEDQPTWRTRAYFYWRRMNGLIGRSLAASLILGVVASPECGWMDNSWSVLRE